MKTKHTPGPWKAHGNSSRPRRPINIRAGDREVAILKGETATFAVKGEERIANAFLIAAAPGMFKMLKQLSTISTLNETWDRELQDLIAQAEGFE